MTENQITEKIIGAAIEVHKNLGPGLLESAYDLCLLYEFEQLGLRIEKQKPLPVIYKEVTLDCGYRLDYIVEKTIIVELKSVDALHPIHTAQLLTYLKLSSCHLGLLINFNSIKLIDGLKRVINNYKLVS
jgi:GxxExxY protein